MEYYLAYKRKETLPFATTWMNCEDIMPCEASDTETETAWCHWYVEPKQAEYRGRESGMAGPAVGVLEEKEMLGHRVQSYVGWIRLEI